MKKLIFALSLIIVLSVFCLSAFASETTVYVSAKGDDTATGTALAPMKSLHAAFRALPYGGRIVIIDAITIEATEFPASRGLVTITSHDGTTDYRTKNGAKLVFTGNLYLKSAVKFENLKFYYSEESLNIICNGNYTCFGDGLTFTATIGGYTPPIVTVGSLGLVPSDGGYVEIHSGNFSRIYCGAAGASSAPHGGNTTLAIYGGTFNDTVYMAGATELTGNTNIYIYGGTFKAGLVGAANTNISGNLSLSVYDGDFAGYVRPATKGILSGNCTINLLGGNITTVYNVDGGSIGGELKINLADGITLTHCPYNTTPVSEDEVSEITEADDAALASALNAKFPTYTENPLIARNNKYTGITPKATYFVKEVAGGDFNSDGAVTLIDAMHSLRAVVSGEYNALADINEDKNVSVLDFLTVLKTSLDSGEPITTYEVENNISKNLIRYGGSTVTDNVLSGGYIFGTTTDTAYTIRSNVKLEEDGIVGLYFGCSSSSPTTANGYYFEANTAEGNITVYRIESSNYRIIAENKLHLMSDEAEIKVVYGKNYASNSVQFYFNDNPLVTDHYLDFDLVLDLKGTGVGMYVENAVATTPVITTETMLSDNGNTYQNFIIGSATDPEVYYENGTYYIYCTSSGGLSGVQCYSTTDFITFTDLGTVLTVENAYGSKSVTAANILYHDNVYYMFYLQYSDTLGYSTTACATANNPSGPFVSEEKLPLTTVTDLIGGQPFVDDDGKVYLIYTRTTGGNKTCIAELKFNEGKPELDLSTETLLLTPTSDWEYAKASVLECGFMIKHEGTYYLIYAGGNYNSTYGVGYATSDNIYGPYTKYEHNPIMWSNDQAFGNGAASVFVSPDQSEHFIIYLRNTSPTTTRPLNTCIDRIRFVENPNGDIDILEIEGATVTPRPLPSGIGSTFAFDYQMARWHW